MRLSDLPTWLQRLGLISTRPLKRVPKRWNGWSSECESLESRALLSAASRNAHMDEAQPAEVARTPRKTQPVVPSVGGIWNIVTTSEYFGSGTVSMVQNGKSVTSTFTLEDLPSFTTTTTFKRRTPNDLISKSPRIEVPGSAVLVRLKIEINFQQGNQTPNAFTGTVNAPVIPKPLLPPPLASLAGTK